MLTESIVRFLLGGAIVSAFAVLGDLFRPKSFAGLFDAAPSVAIATLTLAASRDGALFAAGEARSMLAGAAAMLAYACVACLCLLRQQRSALAVAIGAMPIWFAVAFALWLVALR